MKVKPWSIPGADDQPILGDAHVPGDARGVVIIAHGFKGYKDYGMFPRIAAHFAERGFIAHRFNFSHSGMTNRIETFVRPDLFERDTWNKQVFDLRRIIEAIAAGDLDGGGLPYVLFGHSRGGVSVLLTAGRFADDDRFPQPAGVITASAPATCNSLSEEDSRRLMEQGWIESPSSRTGQTLRLGRAFLREQIDDPTAHDLPALVRRLKCPLLIVHGENDPTVPVDAAHALARAAQADVRTLVDSGADHVFNTPNPMPADAAPSPQLAALLTAATAFAKAACGLA
jgi:uncharacterized protein